MAELRKHRDLSELVFGLVLEDRLDAGDIDGKMLTYPYNRAIEDLPDTDAAELSLKYGHEAIHAAMEAAKRTNGIAPHHWVTQLANTFRDYKIVNLMGRVTKKLDQGEDVDWGATLNSLGQLTDPVTTEPLSWADLKGDFSHEWMWNGWIPCNEMTLLVGWQEAGKSAVALSLVDAIANGTLLPDGSHCPNQTNVLWIETEGRHSENVHRSREWEIRADRIFSPAGNSRRVIDLTQPDDKALIRAHAMQESIGLVVIDSLGGSLMDENDAQAKRIMQEMAKLAQETQTTVLLIHHLRKPQGKEKGTRPTLHMVRGHSGITQFVPSVIAIEHDPDLPYRTLFSLKNNFIEKPRDIEFTIGALGPLFGANMVSEVQRTIVDEFIDWMETISTPIQSKDLLKQAREEGYEKDIIRLALRHSRVQVSRYNGLTFISTKETR
jgi:hypothetical protein